MHVPNDDLDYQEYLRKTMDAKTMNGEALVFLFVMMSMIRGKMAEIDITNPFCIAFRRTRRSAMRCISTITS